MGFSRVEVTTTPEQSESAQPPWRRWGHLAILAIILLASFLLKLNNLGHLSIKGLDESFHAVVARNLLKHPLTPTLVDRPVLDYDYTDWLTNHVWLHKPVMPLWQIALSFALLGVNTFALRLPSAILATAAAGLTYAIGRELFGRTTGLIAAAFQALTPFIVTIVQGYIFSDHVDISLLFWTELSVWLLVRAVLKGGVRCAALAGAAQGVAFLSKTYPALIVTGIALAVWVLLRVGFKIDDNGNDPAPRKRFGWRHVLALIAATLVTAAPWMIYTAVRFPKEFAWEHLQIFRHLSGDVEGFAAPWDRVVFDYSVNAYHLFYPAVLAAAAVLAVRAWQERNLRLAFAFAWGLGVLVPHLVAASKTPTATLIGWPAFFLLFAEMIRRAVRGDGLCLGAWAGATIVGAVHFQKIPRSGLGYPDPPAAGVIMRQNLWVVWHVLAAIAVGIVLARLVRWPQFTRERRLGVVAAATLASLVLAWPAARDSWRITEQSRRDTPTFVKLAERVQTVLPADAVLLVDERMKFERVMVMFFIDRPAYAVTAENWRHIAIEVTAKGSKPYLVTHRQLPLPMVIRDTGEGKTVYDAR